MSSIGHNKTKKTKNMFQLFYDKGLFDSFPNKAKFLKKT